MNTATSHRFWLHRRLYLQARSWKDVDNSFGQKVLQTYQGTAHLFKHLMFKQILAQNQEKHKSLRPHENDKADTQKLSRGEAISAINKILLLVFNVSTNLEFCTTFVYRELKSNILTYDKHVHLTAFWFSGFANLTMQI